MKLKFVPLFRAKEIKEKKSVLDSFLTEIQEHKRKSFRGLTKNKNSPRSSRNIELVPFK